MDWIKLVFSGIWDFIKPMVKELMSGAGKALMAAALVAVSEVEKNLTGASSTDKRNAAFDNIVEELKKQGISMSAKFINSAIETAVIKLSDK